MSVYVGRDVNVIITKETEGDMGAYIAQEVTFEPRVEIDAVDALGSDTVQYWVPGLKTYQGTLREMFKVGEDGKRQLERSPALQSGFEEYTVKLVWDAGTGNKITVELAGCIFPEVTVNSRKNEPSTITARFRAKSATVSIS
ncbi:MAG: hypothetical protein QXR62_05750 [Candidatus Bathyarchaeia archaeon]